MATPSRIMACRLRAVARFWLCTCWFCSRAWNGWNSPLLTRSSHTPPTASAARSVAASSRQASAGSAQNSRAARRAPTVRVNRAENAPTSPSSVAAMYTAPMALLDMPQRSYSSWFKNTVTVWWTSVSRPTATRNASSPGAASVARSVRANGSRGAFCAAGAGRTSAKPSESSAAAP